MIVVDANVIAYRFIVGEKTELACAVQEKDRSWIVPALWRHEFLNILATTVRARILTTSEAGAVWIDALRLLEKRERPLHYEGAVACAVEARISAYDAQYVTLARMHNCCCVSEDSRLRRAFPGIVLSMKEFLKAGKHHNS